MKSCNETMEEARVGFWGANRANWGIVVAASGIRLGNSKQVGTEETYPLPRQSLPLGDITSSRGSAAEVRKIPGSLWCKVEFNR